MPTWDATMAQPVIAYDRRFGGQSNSPMVVQTWDVVEAFDPNDRFAPLTPERAQYDELSPRKHYALCSALSITFSPTRSPTGSPPSCISNSGAWCGRGGPLGAIPTRK